MSSPGDRLSAAVSWLEHNASNHAAQVIPFLEKLPLRTMTKTEMKFTLGRSVMQNNNQMTEIINEALNQQKLTSMSNLESEVRGVPGVKKQNVW